MTTTSPLRILVAGDRDDTRLTACWMLERAFDPVEVLQATSLGEATESCGGDRVDCILIDAQASDFEDVLKAVLTAAGPGLVPVVVLLGKGDEAARATAQQLGVIDWLRKDQISPAVVGLTVRRAIDVASLRLMLAEQGRELEWLRKSEVDARKEAAAKEEELLTIGSYRVRNSDVMPVSAGVETESVKVVKEVAVALAAPPVVTEVIAPPREQPPRELATPRELPDPPPRELLVAPRLVTGGFGIPTAEDDELATRIQKDLMPAGAPYLDGFDVAGLTLPAASTGGDYYDYLPVGDDLLTIAIGECSGHGLGPAMIVASLRAYLRVLTANSMNLSDIVSKTNTLITEDVGDEEFLVTLMLVQIDQLTKSMRYCSAGHQGFLLTRDGEVQVLRSTGMAMGLQVETVISEAEDIRLRTGDAVLLATDGLQKMVSRHGEKFGTERMIELIRKNRDLPARMIIDYLKKACRDFADPKGRAEDVTLVLVKCDGSDRFSG